MLFDIVVFAISLIVLSKASHETIRRSMEIARHFGLSETAVGFLLVAVATSLPELIVSVTAMSTGNSGLAVGNIIGSNIADILLVLGVAAAMGGLVIKPRQAKANSEILLLITIAPLLFFVKGTLEFTDGLVLLLVFAAYALFVTQAKFSIALNNKVSLVEWFTTNVFFWIAIFFVIASAQFTVSSGVNLATMLNVPASVIGLTLIAVGTSLPELAIAIKAVQHGHKALAISETIGSCVVNLTLVLGAAALVNPVTANVAVLASSLVFLVFTSALLWYTITKYDGISKRQGIAYIVIYLIFLLLISGVGVSV